MKIKDIKNEEIRNLAIVNCKLDSKKHEIYRTSDQVFNVQLGSAFVWHKTQEGSEFWSKVNRGETPKIPITGKSGDMIIIDDPLSQDELKDHRKDAFEYMKHPELSKLYDEAFQAGYEQAIKDYDIDVDKQVKKGEDEEK